MVEEMYWKDSFIYLFEDRYLDKKIECLMEMYVLQNEGIIYKDCPHKIQISIKSDKIYLEFVGKKIRDRIKNLVLSW
jgi:hypothetical protein